MPENTASTTTIPHTGTSQCRTHRGGAPFDAEIHQYGDVQKQKSAQGAEIHDRCQIVEPVFHEQATASDSAAVTSMPTYGVW